MLPAVLRLVVRRPGMKSQRVDRRIVVRRAAR
jgi:hypothetical protein